MIYQATEQHISGIHSLLQAAAAHLRKNGIEQWVESYPAIDIIQADVAAKEAFVMLEADQVIATITLNTNQDPQYKEIDWKYEADKVLVVHRLGVHPDFQGQGHAHQLMDWAEKLAKEKGCEVIRLDAYSRNPRSQAFYRRRGYLVPSKQVQFPYQLFPCNCFELKID